jgi:hypothetical protein
MPVAIGLAQGEKRLLKTLPGGYVVLRRMTYGEKMHRSGLMSGMKFRSQKGQKDFEGEIQMANRRVTEYEFATCVVDHNLEKEDGVKLDLRNPSDLNMLDGRIGDEIGQLMNDLNLFEEDEELGNSQTGSEITS